MSGQQILTLLPEVMRAVGAIEKAKRTEAQGRYLFRGIDDALNHIGPELARLGVTVSIEVTDHVIRYEKVSLGREKERVETYVTLRLKLTFHAPDGSSVSSIAAGEGQDYGGDKATNKAMAAAMKYALFFGLVIPVDASAIDDSDHDRKEESRPKSPPASTRSEAKPAESKGLDYVAGIRNILKNCGAKTPDLVTMLLTWATDGHVTTPDQVKSDPAAAKETYDGLAALSKQHGAKNLLAKAQEINNASQGW